MIGILLAIGIPVTYILVGSAVAIRVHYMPQVQNHRYALDGDRFVPGIFCGFIWPVAILYLSMWWLMRGRYQTVRLTRSQRKAVIAQKRIDQMERELGMGS